MPQRFSPTAILVVGALALSSCAAGEDVLTEAESDASPDEGAVRS